MNRAGFLKRAAAAAAALTVGSKLDRAQAVLAPPEPLVEDAPVLSNGWQNIVASGGLCTPVTPYYDLKLVGVTDPLVRDALPGFRADRGGVWYRRPT